MPTERREQHSYVSPWNCHTGNVRLNVTKKGIWKDRNIVQIPGVATIRIQWMRLHRRHGTMKNERMTIKNTS